MKKAIASALAISALALAGCSSTSSSSADGSGVKLVNDGKLTMCTNTPYKPFEYEDGGKIVGFDPDLGEAIAKDLGVELNVTTASFESMDSGVALSSGQCDIALSGITVTDERKSKMAFTETYLDDNLAVMVKGDTKITSASELSGKKVAVQQATSGQAEAEKQGADVVQFEDASLMIQALQTGQVDAVVGNISILSDALSSDSSLKIATEIETGEQLAGAIATDNTELLNKANETIKKMKDDGDLAKLQEKWLGTSNDGASASATK